MILSSAAEARLAAATFDDIRTLLKGGQESAAELTSYYYLRNYPRSEETLEVKFLLADIYDRQTRLDEMVLWLKDIEKDPQLKGETQPRVAYLLYNAQIKRGDAASADIQKSLLLRKYPLSEWSKKVVSQ